MDLMYSQAGCASRLSPPDKRTVIRTGVFEACFPVFFRDWARGLFPGVTPTCTVCSPGDLL